MYKHRTWHSCFTRPKFFRVENKGYNETPYLRSYTMSGFAKLLIFIAVVVVIGYIGFEILDFVNAANEISSGTSDQL